MEENKEFKPTLEKGNYILEVLDDKYNVVKKIVVCNSSINVVNLGDNAFTIDLPIVPQQPQQEQVEEK